jgi:hypothetical protein
MNVTTPLFEPITSGEPRTWTPHQGRADIAPSRYERIKRDGYLTIDAHWVVPGCCGPLRSRAGYWSRPPARSRTTARPFPRARRASAATLVGRSPAPNTEPRGRRQ